MGLWDRLKDKVEKKKAEVQQKAVERAADMAIQKTKDTAKNALDSMGKSIENAIFGPDSKKSDEDAPDSDSGSHSDRPQATREEEAKQKARAKEKARAKSKASSESAPPVAKEPLSRDYDKFVKDRAQKERDLDKAVDDDLAALKKKLGKK